MRSDAPQMDQGWVILDESGKVWAKSFFAAKADAESMAEAAVIGRYSIAPARRITSLAKGSATTARMLSQIVLEQPE